MEFHFLMNHILYIPGVLAGPKKVTWLSIVEGKREKSQDRLSFIERTGKENRTDY